MSSVTIEGTRAVLSCLEEQEINEYFFKVSDDELYKKLKNVIGIGVAVLNRVEVSRDVEFVKKQVDGMIESFKHTVSMLEKDTAAQMTSYLEASFSATGDKSYLKKTADFIRDKLASVNSEVKLIIDNASKVSSDKLVSIEAGIKSAETNFDPNLESSYLGKVKQTLNSAVDRIDSLLDERNKDSFASKLNDQTDKLFGVDSPVITVIRTVMENYVSEFNKEIISLREEIARKEGEREMLQQTAVVKGAIFEEELFGKLEEIAQKYGDIVERTGTEVNASSSKKGDYVYSFSGGKKIVIEAKDEAIGVKPMQKYLDEAMNNREVDFSILVTKSQDQLQKQVGMLNLYDGNKLFVSADFVEFALRFARLYVTAVKTETAEGIDKGKFTQVLATINSQFTNFKSIKQKLTSMQTSVTTSVTAVGELLDGVKTQVEAQIEELESMVD